MLLYGYVDWKRPLRQPCLMWMKTVQNDLDSHKLRCTEAVNLAPNQPLWRLLATSGGTYSYRNYRCMPKMTTMIPRYAGSSTRISGDCQCHIFLHAANVLPVTEPTVSKHWRNINSNKNSDTKGHMTDRHSKPSVHGSLAPCCPCLSTHT